MDRRADPRVEVRLPCHAVLPGTRARIFVGLTENISRSGVLLAWSEELGSSLLPQPGDFLTVDIELPANRSFGRRCMHCEAVVARVIEGDPESGTRIALLVNQMSFRSANGRCGSQAGQAASCTVM